MDQEYLDQFTVYCKTCLEFTKQGYCECEEPLEYIHCTVHFKRLEKLNEHLENKLICTECGSGSIDVLKERDVLGTFNVVFIVSWMTLHG